MNILTEKSKSPPKAPAANKSKGPLIYVGRQGQIIGEYYLAGIEKGIACGYFVPKDRGWYEGLSEWLRIGDVVKSLTSTPTKSSSLMPVPNNDRAQRQATKILSARLTQKLSLSQDSA